MPRWCVFLGTPVDLRDLLILAGDIELNPGPCSTVLKCDKCNGNVTQKSRFACSEEGCSSVCHIEKKCSKLGRWKKSHPWWCRTLDPTAVDENNNQIRVDENNNHPESPDTPNNQQQANQQANIPSYQGLPCAVCKKLFAKSHRPIKCQVVGCSKLTHKGTKCSKIKQGSKTSTWTCVEHRDEEDIPPPSEPIVIEKGTPCARC